ncbi:hypothetical protein F53441_12489 [Fusarium austroafricanum]|uniref:Heterokaryon incompatibility domain-containing protein n=1 Tax=Fusarium austroafricanum TaxID=2364996 RepID=A0A8H4JY63_9HYPO|nr:hypothetical protein F53441_12489 [Fusarium austroafricanum]
MQIPTITWPDSPQSHSCWFNTLQTTKSRSIEEIHKEGEKGCHRCILVYLTCSRYIGSRCDLDIRVVKQDNGLFWVIGTERSGAGLPPITYQLYNSVGTQRPAWELVKPGRVSSAGRREEYRALLKEWIGSCNSAHQNCKVKNPELPQRVLDIGDDINNHICLHISEHQIAPYVALSHCWGKSPLLQTTTSNIADHMNTISFGNLSKNFQDAVTITRSIGIRYLWIDSLCIVQDDEADWEIESSKMASIYNNAYLVLAASQAARSSDGFLDRKDVDFNNSEQLDPSKSLKIARMNNPDSTMSEIYNRPMSTDPTAGISRHRWKVTSSPLNQRGWVLQENILARRIVHFTESEMIWDCVESLKCECMEIEANESEVTHWSEFNMVRDFKTAALHGERYTETQRITDLHVRWRKLIALYGRLILTKDTDRLPALSGLAKLCQSHGTGEYLADLWGNDLLISLVWHIRTDEPVKKWGGYMAPSWSPFSVGYIERSDGLIEAGYWYCQDETYHERWAEPQAQILEAQCIPAGHDPTGAVKDGSIVLSGPMRKGNPNTLSDPRAWTVWDWVFFDHPSEQVNRSEIIFLLLWTDFDLGYISALCLLPSETIPKAYRRVGIVDDHWGNKELACFFKNTEEGEVKVV